MRPGMNIKTVIGAACAVTIIAGGAAVAQDRVWLACDYTTSHGDLNFPLTVMSFEEGSVRTHDVSESYRTVLDLCAPDASSRFRVDAECRINDERVFVNIAFFNSRRAASAGGPPSDWLQLEIDRRTGRATGDYSVNGNDARIRGVCRRTADPRPSAAF